MMKLTRSWLLGYGVAVLAVAFTLLLMLLLNRVIDVTASPFLLFFIPVFISASYGGLEPGLVATVLTALAIAYFFLPPFYSPALDQHELPRIILFVLEGILFSAPIAIAQTAKQKSEATSENLRTSNEQLKLALEAAYMGTWDWNIITDSVTWSENHELLFGLQPGAFNGSYEAFLSCVHPEDRLSIANAISYAIDSKTDYNEEFRVIWPDGSIHWIAGRGQFFYDAVGTATRMIGVIWDVSDRKQIELERTHLLECEQQARYEAVQAETRTTNILESITDAFVTLDTQWCYTYVNPKAEQLLGKTRQQLIGKNIWEIFSTATESPIYPLAHRAVAEQVTTASEYFSLSLNKWLAVRLYPSQEGLAIYFQDITERKQIEEALRNSEQRYRTLLEAIPQIVFTAQPDGRCNYINQQWCDYTGMSVEQSQDFGWISALHPDDLQQCMAVWQESQRTGNVFDNEYRFRRVDGMYRWHLGRSLPVKDGDGNIFAWFGTCTDIHDQKQLEVLLQQQAEVLRNQQQWLENVLNLMPTPMLFIEPGTARVLFANKAADELAGGEFPRHKPADEYHTVYYCTDAAGDRIPDEQMPGVRVARGERLEGFEMNWQTSGGVRPILVFADTVPPMHGHPATCILVFQDVSKLKQVEKALQEGNQRLQLLSETASNLLSTEQPLALFASLFDKLKAQMGLDVYFNYLVDENSQRLRLESYSGISPEVAKEIEWLEFEQAVCGTVAVERQQIAIANISQSTDSKTQLLRSLELIAYCCQPLIARGRFLGTLSFGSRSRSSFKVEEIALMQAVCDQMAMAMERARLIDSLQQQAEQLREANRMKDEFLAVVSHELRSPLNSMLGWAQMLRSQKLSDAMTAKAIETIERNARNQKQLIEDLLDVSRIITGKLRLNVRSLELAPILEAAIDSVRPAADAKAISLSYLPHPSTTPISGDSERLQQVFWNLLSNAIKFTPNGGCVEVKLEELQIADCRLQIESENSTSALLNLKSEISYAQITISDSGIGIKPEFLPYVFERFRQADSSSTRAYGGLGLGLAIVRHLVELHGGTVGVTSSGEGQGTTFTVKLPLLTKKERESGRAGERESDASFPPPLPYPLAGLQVLVVDDETDTREFLVTVLQSYGATVKAATSVREALETIEQWRPDVLLSDIGMPEADGYALIRQVRSLPAERGGQIPAVALTAYARTEERKQALQAGFQMHLSKPVEPTELVKVIASLAADLKPIHELTRSKPHKNL